MAKKKLLFEFREGVRNLGNSLLNKGHTLHYEYQNKELSAFKSFFDSVESNPLTASQRKSIILDEKRNLIIAGAGSGKTSVLVGKCGYLLRKGLANEDEILLLAYNNDAAKELDERIKDKLGVNVKVKTFHALGLEIIDSCNENNLNISNIFTQRKESLDFFDEFLALALRNKSVYSSLASFLSKHTIAYHDEFESFKTLQEYKNWITRNNLITLQGEKVKSYGELIIANTLFLNDIKYKYEDYYEPNEGKLRSRYSPDFHLLDVNSYIEYFGIDRAGNTAPYIDKEKYNKEIAWKRDIHHKHDTELVELYYYDLKEGNLESKLQSELKRLGLDLSSRDDESILEAANNVQYTSKLFNLLKTFLGHFKSNEQSISYLRQNKIKGNRDSLFLDIFESFNDLYKTKLETSDAIDFDDMILKSCRYVKNSAYRHSFKYILVDEYQDISMSRFKLLTSLLNQNPESKLFCVGDDWQSIYRFSGADVGLMTSFRDFLGKETTIEKLDLTFRYNKSLSEVSSEFIQKNRNQIKKSVKSFDISETKNVKIHFRTTLKDGVLDAINHIKQKNNINENHKLLLLARYNRNLPVDQVIQAMRKLWPGSIDMMSCHSSKGLESDFVIILDTVSSDLGFPSEVSDDPVLNMVLNQQDHFPHEEERRLFYVALTRAKKEVHLLTTYANPSVFVEEIKANKNVDVIEYQAGHKPKCPSCDSGIIIESQNGFLYCSNRPLCEFSPPKCSECSSGKILKVGEREFCCSNKECLHSPHACPACDSGFLIQRTSQYGSFYGCSNFSSTGCKGK